jgi:hypothetical protein
MRGWRSTASTSARRAGIWKKLGVCSVARLKSRGRDEEVKQPETAQAHLDDAQRMAGKLDQSANSRAGEAAKSIADVLSAEAKR